ncbi:exocyst complex component exo84 [Malassezia caprae]|uniref:Exocyst complex component EXO84 n=1 Tax=Malassezia caprae TaxID=1381934 RepID=A0AAF0E523_9BASI|nr:exocyst complex component exo84 [Malassezia caprae]
MSRSQRSRPATLYGKSGDGQEPLPRPSRKPVPDSHAEDKVRNRLSMRYASSSIMPAVSFMSGLDHLAPVAGSRSPMPPVAEDVPPVPPVPAMAATPHALSPVATRSPVPPMHANLAVESWEAHAVPGVSAESFAAENFDPSLFVSQQVQQQSEAGLQNLRATLGQIQTTTQKQLKEQVFKNYAEFIVISREIATFENDMLEFKELLSEWKALPHQLQIEDPLGEGMWDNESSLRAIRKGHRISSIDLEQIYKAQLTSLWENIEGSQKFVPIVPGRHLIAETSQFVEVNAATYKPKQAVALFLLDDLLLIAVQRKRPYGNRVHLVAERCFNLSEIVVVDLKDTKDVRNALKIKHGKESFVYRTERSQDKRALLRAFRGVGEALAARLKKERKQRAVKRNDDGMLGDSMDPTSQDLGLADKASAPAPSQDDLAALGPWLNSVIDALAVHIALREWEEAVALVEEGKQRLASRPVSEGSLYLLVEKFNGCASDLVRAISAELVSPYQRKSMVVRNAGLLVRLDKGREARDLLLEARTTLLQRRMRQIKYEGDVSLYISELAMLYFTLIKNTGDWYMAAFKDYKMASGFVQWASDQVRAYADTFRRQVFGVDQDPRVVQEAIDITRSCAQILNDVGLGLGFMLDDLLKPSDGATVQRPALLVSQASVTNTLLASRERRPYEWHSEPPE